MHWSSVRRYLRTYKIYGRQSTSVTYGFASAVARREAADQNAILQSLKILEQDAENLSCTYCGKPAQSWDHLVPVVKAGRQFGPGHRIRNLVPCCSGCSGSKGNQDFEVWLPRRFQNWEETLGRLRIYAAGLIQEPPLPPPIAAEIDAELDRYWSVRDRIFELMREADDIAIRIRGLRGETGHTDPEPQRLRKAGLNGSALSYDPKPGTIGWLCIKLLQQQWPDAAILDEVRRQFPQSKTGKNSLAWYKTKLRQMPNSPAS